MTRHKSYFQAAKMQNTGFRLFHEAYVSRAPVSKACVVRVWPWPLTFLPGHEFGFFIMSFELWPWIKTFGQGGSWLGINLIFRPPKYRKIATGRFTKRQKDVSRTPISNEACVVRVWPWPLTFHPGHLVGLFAWPLNFELELKLLARGVHNSA